MDTDTNPVEANLHPPWLNIGYAFYANPANAFAACRDTACKRLLRRRRPVWSILLFNPGFDRQQPPAAPEYYRRCWLNISFTECARLKGG